MAIRTHFVLVLSQRGCKTTQWHVSMADMAETRHMRSRHLGARLARTLFGPLSQDHAGHPEKKKAGDP